VLLFQAEKAFAVTADLYQTDKIKKNLTDNKFLTCALDVKADNIVSGDNHLQGLKIQILTSAKAFTTQVEHRLK